MSEQTGQLSFAINATYVLHPADAQVLKAVISRLAQDTALRSGSLFLHETNDTIQPNILYLFEGWESQQAFDEQLASREFQDTFREALALWIVDR